MDSFLNDFHFLRPSWLWLSVVWLVIFWLYRMAVSTTQWHQHIPSHLANALLNHSKVKNQRGIGGTLLIAGLISVLALAGPTWQRIEKPVFKANKASVIVMDMSLSMRSTDLSPDRLTRARYKAIDLVKSLGDGEFGLVAYAADAFIISPLTEDPNNIANLIPSLSPEIMPDQGSNALAGLRLAEQLLLQAGHIAGDIYWFTDGVDREDRNELISFGQQSSHRIHILAVATNDGAPISLSDGSLLKDHRGNIVIPKLDVAPLAQISNVSGGIFVVANATDLDIKTLTNDANKVLLEKQAEQTEHNATGDDWQEFGPTLLIAVLALLLSHFRRGAQFMLVGFVMLLPSWPSIAGDDHSHATPSTPTEFSVFDNWFKNADQKGLQAFNRKDFSGASALFEDPAWQAAAAYKAGDYQSALQLYQQDSSAKGLYNSGNALAQLGQYQEAIDAYNRALELEPDFTEASTNKALIEALLQQQDKQKDQQNAENQQGGQSSQDDSNQDPEQSQSGDQSQQSESESQQSESNQSDSEQADPTSNSEQAGQSQQESGEQTESEPTDQQVSEQQGEQQQAELQATPLTAEQVAEQENQQKLQQLLRKVSDDPAVLIRNKMILESRKRQQQPKPPKGAVKSW